MIFYSSAHLILLQIQQNLITIEILSLRNVAMILDLGFDMMSNQATVSTNFSHNKNVSYREALCRKFIRLS